MLSTGVFFLRGTDEGGGHDTTHFFSSADTNPRFLFMTLSWKFGQQNEYWNSRAESGLPALLLTSHAVFSIWMFLVNKGSCVMISHIGTLQGPVETSSEAPVLFFTC